MKIALNGPALWADILNPVSSIFGPNAVIAGGAVRDYLLGYEPKDIDVFVDSTREHLAAAKPRLEAFGFTDITLLTDATTCQYTDWQPDLKGVLDMQFGGRQVQIIARRFSSMAELAGQFDLAICQSIYFPGGIFSTPEAKADRQNKTLTRTRYGTDEAYSATMERVERFKAKYEGFRFVDPRNGIS